MKVFKLKSIDNSPMEIGLEKIQEKKLFFV